MNNRSNIVLKIVAIGLCLILLGSAAPVTHAAAPTVPAIRKDEAALETFVAEQTRTMLLLLFMGDDMIRIVDTSGAGAVDVTDDFIEAKQALYRQGQWSAIVQEMKRDALTFAFSGSLLDVAISGLSALEAEEKVPLDRLVAVIYALFNLPDAVTLWSGTRIDAANVTEAFVEKYRDAYADGDMDVLEEALLEREIHLGRTFAQHMLNPLYSRQEARAEQNYPVSGRFLEAIGRVFDGDMIVISQTATDITAAFKETTAAAKAAGDYDAIRSAFIEQASVLMPLPEK